MRGIGLFFVDLIKNNDIICNYGVELKKIIVSMLMYIF